jgi:hypothetical protein
MEIDRERGVWSKIALGHPCGCWEWTGAPNPNGYGYATAGSKRPLAHRLVYELLVGPIPDGLQLDHLCRNRLCVNPDHLEPVTAHVNLHRGYGRTRFRSEQTVCVRGHDFTPENTYINSRGNRTCRTCSQMHEQNRVRPSTEQSRAAAAERQRQYRLRKKEALSWK